MRCCRFFRPQFAILLFRLERKLLLEATVALCQAEAASLAPRLERGPRYAPVNNMMDGPTNLPGKHLLADRTPA
eukprot:SAG31_NODE_4644_length_3076_cov_2.880417_3_plen_74_part_00